MLLWVAVGIASSALWPIYQGTAIVVLVVVTTLLASAVAIAGAVWRWPSIVVAGVSVAVFLAAGVPLAVPGQARFAVLPTLEGLGELVSGVALGWKRLLTISLPVGDYQALLVPAYVLVFATVVVSLSVALRAPRGGPAAAGPLLLFLVALALGPDAPIRPVSSSLALVVTTLAWLMWRRWYARRAAVRVLAARTGVAPDHRFRLFGLRTAVSAAVIVAVALAAGVGAVALAPPVQQREVLRSVTEQPFDPRDYVSPLAGFRSYLRDDEASTVLFTVTGLPAGQRLRLATLDDYDGIVYALGDSTGAFTRVPFRLDQSALDGTEVSLGVTVGDYSGPWLPSTGHLQAIEFGGDRATELRDAFYYSDPVSTAAVIGGLRPGDSYRVEAVETAQPAVADLAAVSPGVAVVPAAGLLPEGTRARLDGYVQGVTGAGDRLVAMLAGLRTDGYISHGAAPAEVPSRSGHAADRITELLTDQQMIGDAEQYSVAAALMARELGFPARVVFGFAPSSADGGPVEVTGADVSAWIEVDTAEFGWVSVDPTPPERAIPEAPPEEPTTVSRPESVIAPPVVEPPKVEQRAPQDATPEEPVADEGWIAVALAVARVVGWVVVAVAVLLAPFLVVIAAKARRRRRRRRAPTPLARITGGWQEYRDSVVDHGFVTAPSATRREVAAVVGGAQPALLAAISDRAVFAPREPSDEEAEKVWRAVVDLSRSLDAGTSRWERLRARVSARSLRAGRRR